MSFKCRGRIRRRQSVKDLPVTRVEVLEALRQNSLDKFFIEFNGYFTNHLALAAVALYKLGASKERFTAFVEHYISQLEPAEGPTRTTQDEDVDLADATSDHLKGRRQGFYKLRQHFHILLHDRYEDDANSKNDAYSALVRAEFPRLALGMAGACFHGLEALGAAITLEAQELVCDALAYLQHSFCPNYLTIPRDIHQLGRGSLSLPEALTQLGRDFELSSFLAREKLTSLQASLAVLLQRRTDALMDYVYTVKMPAALADAPDRLAEWVTDQMIMVYQSSDPRNDFYLLHAVTSSFALCKVLSLFDKEHKYFKLEALRVHLCNLFALYLAQKSPALREENLDMPNVASNTWEKLREAVLAKHSSTDEHVFELVYVCHERSLTNRDAKMAEIYKRASRTVMETDRFYK